MPSQVGVKTNGSMVIWPVGGRVVPLDAGGGAFAVESYAWIEIIPTLWAVTDSSLCVARNGLVWSSSYKLNLKRRRRRSNRHRQPAQKPSSKVTQDPAVAAWSCRTPGL